jgi:hypothetical protein
MGSGDGGGTDAGRELTARTARWRAHFRMSKRKAIGLAVLAVLAVVFVFGARWRAAWIFDRLLRDWATGIVAEASGGVYQLGLGRVHVDVSLRRVRVDSISLTTHGPVNERRPQPLPGLRFALSRCTISGVHIATLIRSNGVIAGSFGCRSGSVALELPRHAGGAKTSRSAAAGRVSGERQPFLEFQQAVRPPAYAPRVRIARVAFPRLALDVRLPRTTRGAIRLELERLNWSMTDLAIDPADTAAATRPLFSRTIELAATNFVTHPDRATAVRVGMLRTSLTDSTLELRDVDFAPTGSNAAFTRSQRYRNDLVRLTVGRIAAQGVDFGALIVGEGVWARRIDVDSFRIDVTSDKRLPVNPRGHPHRTPQQWIAGLDETLSLDSLRVRDGEVVYREHAAGRDNVGVFTFTRIEATATNVTHVVGRRTSGAPMTLSATARIQDAGQLAVRAVVPLDAPRFDMTLRGTVGAMPAMAFNTFVVKTQALQIERGQLAGIAFSVAVKNGVASGTITPRFNDLSVSVTRRGSEGLLGNRGIFGGAARGIASLAAGLALRQDNPDRPMSAPRVGAIDRTFTPDQPLIGFLWSSVRDGLLAVVKK